MGRNSYCARCTSRSSLVCVRGWYGEELYAISDHFLARECGFLHMNSISITYRHYGNLWFGHMEVLCHPFTYPVFLPHRHTRRRPPRACIRCPCFLHRSNRTMTRTPSCAYPPARIKNAKDHAQTPQCSRTRAFEVRGSVVARYSRLSTGNGWSVRGRLAHWAGAHARPGHTCIV